MLSGLIREPGACPCCPLRAGNSELQRRIGELEAAVGELTDRLAQLRTEKDRVEQEASRLRARLATLHRARKRQAAPFSKGPPSPDPKKPGRKPGAHYGARAQRAAPERIDRRLEAPLSAACPHCGGAVQETIVARQFQTDLPPRIEPEITQIDVHVGRCTRCGRRVQGRHPEQTSDALGAAASQLGPRAQVLAADLKIGLAVSYEKIAELFARHFAITITRGGLCQVVARVGRAAEPTYQALGEAVRHCAVVSPDETGWRVGGRSAWLWTFATERISFYSIQAGRGFEQAKKILGETFAGILVRDGWAPYRRFTSARHQSCLAHLLRRCHENLETALRGTARLPRAVKRILEKALELRDRRDAGSLAANELGKARDNLRQRTRRLLGWKPSDRENHKLVKHLRNEEAALFTFLEQPAVAATNHLAEQALRPVIATRKSCGGGNRTWAGALTTATLATFLRTGRQQGRDPLALLVDLLKSPWPLVATELLPERAPPDPPLTPAPDH